MGNRADRQAANSTPARSAFPGGMAGGRGGGVLGGTAAPGGGSGRGHARLREAGGAPRGQARATGAERDMERAVVPNAQAGTRGARDPGAPPQRPLPSALSAPLARGVPQEEAPCDTRLALTRHARVPRPSA